jgi:hypothetical protein
MPGARRFVALVVCTVAFVLIGAATANAAPSSSGLPPSARQKLAAIFDPKVHHFGLRVTRAALLDGKNRRSARGTHLAIYLQPTGKYTADDYVHGAVTVTRVFLPYVFSRWPNLRTFDVCQEPHPEVDNRPEPAPETQVYASRHSITGINWKTADLHTLMVLAASQSITTGTDRPDVFALYITKHLQTAAAYRDAVGTNPPSTPQSATTTPTTPTYR